MAVLIDSSIWISAQKKSSPVYMHLKEMILKDDLIYLCIPIQVEVCQGARIEEQFYQLWDSFLGFEFLDITDRIWGLSAWNYFRCRKQGVSVTTIDCLIGTLSKEYRIPLWTLDKDFDKMQSIIGFETFTFPL